MLLMGLMFYWVLTPGYALLFGSLSPESAQEIVEELQSMGVRYELDDNGRALRVPRDKVYELRLKFAAEGATGNSYQGYELFDQNSLGMTDFMQRLNQKRALEGELSRTISSLSQVGTARIHIVIPDRSPFQETEVEPSASVILNLERGQRLENAQIEGIGALIAGSIEGLETENVVILDQVGNRISENILVSSEVTAGSSQMRVRRDVEAYLTEKAQSMLDRVLGPGNSIVRVSTQHNFDRIIRESDLIDPDSRIIISEENRSTTNTDQSREAIQGDAEVEPFITSDRADESTVRVRNYEVNKIREQFENEVGEITRISASLLLNHKAETGEDGEPLMEPYTQAEVTSIRNTISSALGIMEDRGDEIEITQIRFQDPYLTGTEADGVAPWLPVSDIIRYLFLATVLIVISWMVYRMSKNFNVEYDTLLSNGSQSPESLNGASEGKYLDGKASDGEAEDFYGNKLSDEARLKMRKQEARNSEIHKFINENPGEAAALVRTMINQSDY